ncbi:MAG: bacillithiol biosynthesis BshC [Candidatus Eisenbacteria bacterium]
MEPRAVRARRRPFPGAAPAHLASYLAGEERLRPLYSAFPLERPLRAPSFLTSAGPIAAETAGRIVALDRAAGEGGSGEDLPAAIGGPGTRFVLAGQQPGILLGPCLAFYKMATLRALADSLSAETGGPVLPLFWIASHDADREEIEGVVLPGPQGEPRKIRCPIEAASARTQVGALSVEPDEWREFLDEVRAALPPSEFAGPILEDLAALVTERTPLPLLFARTARRLGAGAGVLFFDGRDAEIDPRGRSLLAAAVREGPRVIEALRAGADLLEKAGFAPPLPFDAARLPVFRLDGSVRVPLFLEGEGVRAEGEEAAPAGALADRIESGSIRASPAAALRPVVQDAIFPSAGMVAGHSELLYHAELGPLYECLGVRRSPLVPRASFYLLSGRSEERLRKMGLRPEDLLEGKGPETGLGQIETAARGFVERVRGETGELLAAFDRAAPGAVAPDDAIRSRVAREAERTAERLLRLADKSGENRRNQVHRMRNELFPGGKPQETVLSILHPLARFGTEVLGAIAAEAAAGDGTPELLVLERDRT